MKKLILFLFLAFPTFIFATEENETEMVKEIRAFYDGLDHSAMKTDYLFNRGFVILNNLQDWNNGIPIITNIEKWGYIFESVQKSNYKTSGEPIAVEVLKKENTLNDYGISTIALSLIDINGEYISDENIKEYVENKADIKYTTMNIFAGTTLSQNVLNSTVIFKWSPDLYFSNKGLNAGKLYVDFANEEGFYEINTDKPQCVEIKYDCIGEKSICFKKIQNNDTLISFSKIKVVSLENEKPTKVGSVLYSDSSQPRLKSTTSDPNVNLSNGNYSYYEGVDNVLDKPIIIAEGFDIAGTMSRDYLYSKWQDRISPLIAMGYDIFILNFTSPVRSLQSNASVVEDLIRGINQDKIGNFEGVYIGESMSGILGRIALKNMENAGYDHQIGLFVPYDSPFKGANISKGIQWALHDMVGSFGLPLIAGTFLVDLYEFLFDVDVPVADIYSQLNSTAAKQMLARHYTGSSEYNTFQSYLAALGYPSQSRNVAIVNGSDNATYQTAATPGAEIFSEALLLGGLYDITAKAWYDQENNANQEVSRVFYFSLLSPLITQYHRRYEPFDNKPYVNGPGSFVGTDYNSIQFTFVPTLSAIDINSSIYNTNFAYFNNNEDSIIADKLTPFDDIYSDAGPTYYLSYRHGNKFHTTEYFSIDDIILKEIMPINMYLQNKNIIHNRDFEASNSITVGSNTQPWGSAKHQGIGDFIINSGTTVNMVAGQSVKLKSGFKLNSGATFKAKVDPTNPTLKSSSIEKLCPPVIVGDKNATTRSIYSIEKQFDDEEVQWLLLGNDFEYSCNTDVFSLPADLRNGQYTLVCKIGSNGQEASSSKIIVNKSATVSGSLTDNMDVAGCQIFVYPNPANDLITIEFDKPVLENAELTIEDITGKTVLRKSSIGTNKIDINVSTLTKGVYFIHFTNNCIDNKKFIKL